jgi:hypothetical protein
MISSDANVKKIVTLVEDTKEWVELKSAKTRFDVAQKMVHVVGALFFMFVLLLITMIVIACLSFAAAYSLENLVGSKATAFLCIGLFYVVLLAVAYFTRDKWLIAPLARLFSELAPDDLKKKCDTMQTDIALKENSLKNQWNSLVNEEEPVILSPTKRVLSWISDSSHVIDGAILGWKLYRIFGKKKKIL